MVSFSTVPLGTTAPLTHLAVLQAPQWKPENLPSICFFACTHAATIHFHLPRKGLILDTELLESLRLLRLLLEELPERGTVSPMEPGQV